MANIPHDLTPTQKHMALGFLTNKEAREQIAGLETRVSELESEIATAGESLTAAQNELATANESLVEAQSDLGNARERITELETENARIPDLESAAAVSIERTANEAARLLAASGHPSPIEGIEDAEQSNSIKRSDFDKLDHAQRDAFMKSGGKLKA